MIGDLLLGVLSGGATGLLGTAFSRGMDFWDKARERQFILEKYRLDAEMRAQERESEERIAESSAAAAMYQASVTHDMSFVDKSRWVNNLLSLVRPVLTLGLWVLVGLIWYSMVWTSDLPWLDGYTTVKTQIISTVLYCSTAATLWWFGTRDMRNRS